MLRPEAKKWHLHQKLLRPEAEKIAKNESSEKNCQKLLRPEAEKWRPCHKSLRPEAEKWRQKKKKKSRNTVGLSLAQFF